MNNCLLTKLKGVATSNLPKFNTLILRIYGGTSEIQSENPNLTPSNKSLSLNIKTRNEVLISTLDKSDRISTTSYNSNMVNSVDITPSQDYTTIFFKYENDMDYYEIEITNANEITHMSTPGDGVTSSFSNYLSYVTIKGDDYLKCPHLINIGMCMSWNIFNIECLKNSLSLENLNVSPTYSVIGTNLLSDKSKQVIGDIASLGDLTSLNRLILPFTSISGNLSNLYKLNNLTSLYLRGTNVQGDIGELAYAMQRTSGTMDVGYSYYANKFPFFGVGTGTSQKHNYVSWVSNGNIITLHNLQNNGTIWYWFNSDVLTEEQALAALTVFKNENNIQDYTGIKINWTPPE